jgi:Fe-S oxidoreductase
VSIEHIDHIVDLRRSRVMVDSAFPAEAEPMLRDVERAGNPWGKPQTERAAWAEELGVKVLEPGDPAPEYLYWVGCAASFDERAKKSAESTAKLLQKAGVDFAILGPRESCTGDPARRMGNEYVFQAHAEQNIATLKENNVQKIVASCPHCFNTLANEYGDFGGNYEVLHHTELLSQLVEDGRLKPAAGTQSITYHDSCYLARHNDVRMEPRKLLNVIGQPVEMKRSGKQTFCCGAGGAHMWMEEKGTQINVERATEAIGTGAETLAVACPFCTVMLDDGVRETGAEMRVADVSTLLVESLDA